MSFSKEIDLCAAFRSFAESKGFAVYPEIDNWDLVLVDKDGSQIGIQAKLRPNLKVLYQAIQPGPSFRGILVPQADDIFRDICRHLGLALWIPMGYTFIDFGRMAAFDGRSKPLKLPPIITDLPAGGAGPKQLTEWRVKALKLCHILRTRGWVTPQDFKDLKLSPTFWTNSRTGCLECYEKIDKISRYRANGRKNLPDVGWEEIRDKICVPTATTHSTPITT